MPEFSVFVSWSGKRSASAAIALQKWLPEVLQSIECWISKGIHAGQQWRGEIDRQLEAAGFGIICLTKSNFERPWILFEAGALSRGFENLVCPYLLDPELTPEQLKGSPLAAFQSCPMTKEGTYEILKSLNLRLKDGRLDQERLQRQFNRCWPELEAQLDSLPPDSDEEQKAEALQSAPGDAKATIEAAEATPVPGSDGWTGERHHLLFTVAETDRDNIDILASDTQRLSAREGRPFDYIGWHAQSVTRKVDGARRVFVDMSADRPIPEDLLADTAKKLGLSVEDINATPTAKT